MGKFKIKQKVYVNYHQGDIIFPAAHRGNQCTCMSYMAILFSLHQRNVQLWQTTDLNTILEYGDTLYGKLFERMNEGTYLNPREITEYIEMDNVVYHMEISNEQFGFVLCKESIPPFHTLENALSLSFAKSKFHVLVMGTYSTAIFSEKRDAIYVFDSHSRNSDGLPIADGTAVCFSFDSEQSCTSYLQALAKGLHMTKETQFEIYSFNIEKTGPQESSSLPASSQQPTNACMQPNVNNSIQHSPKIKNKRIIKKKQASQESVFDIPQSLGIQQVEKYVKIWSAKQLRQYLESRSICSKGTKFDLECLTLSSFAAEQKSPTDKNILVVGNATCSHCQKQSKSLDEKIFEDGGNKHNNSFVTTTAQSTQSTAASKSNLKGSQWTISQLKTYLRHQNLQTTGNKKKLLERVHAASANRGVDDAANNEDNRCSLMEPQQQTSKPSTDPGVNGTDNVNHLTKNVQHSHNLQSLSEEIKSVHAKRSYNNATDSSSLNNPIPAKKAKVVSKKSKYASCPTYREAVKKRNLQNYYVHKKNKSIASLHNVASDQDIRLEFPEFHAHIEAKPEFFCQSCRKFLFAEQVHKIEKIIFCAKCIKRAKKMANPEQLSVYEENEMNPGETPACLQNLTRMEVRMISKVHPHMKLVALPGGQMGEHGQAISFPSNISTLCNKLPHEDANVVMVKPNGAVCLNYSVHDVVRPSKIKNALLWLKSHNLLYNDVDIVPEVFLNNCTNEAFCQELDDVVQSSMHSLASLENPIQPHVHLKKFLSDTNSALKTLVLEKQTGPAFSIFQNKKSEEMTFPDLYPYGVNGLQQSRNTRFSFLSYFQQRLFHCNDEWRKNLSWLFWALNTHEITKLYNEINIVCRMRKASISGRSQSMTLGDIRNSDDDFTDVGDSYAFMKNIRGTAGYWRDQLFDLLSKINCLGAPTFFLTFSANDLNWPELFTTQDPTINLQDVHKMSKSQKWKMMTSDPVMTAIHFHRRTHALFAYIMGKQCPLGTVNDYWARVEFQLRGSPHLHMFLWIHNAPDLSSVEGLRNAPDFIDKYICTTIPHENQKTLRNLVSKLQTHRHTHTCQKNGNTCRFHFPRPPCDKTRLKGNASMTRNAQFYETQRSSSDQRINAYNVDLLKHWQANIDIQMVGSKYGAAYYVCMYVSKAEPHALKQVLNQVTSSLPQNCPTKQKLAKIGNAVLSHRQLSAQEAAYRLCGLPLVHSSRTTVWINSKIPSKRTRLLKPKCELDSLPDDSCDIFHTGIPQYYSRRPSHETSGDIQWDQMSLATFATSFNVTSQKPASSNSTAYKMTGIDKWAHPRKKPACLRTPQISLTDGDDFYYHLLYTYVPWRNEDDLTTGYDNAKDAFIAKHDTADYTAQPHTQMGEELERAILQLRVLNIDNMDALYAHVAPNTTECCSPEDIVALDATWTASNAEEASNVENCMSSSSTTSQENVHDSSMQWNAITLHRMTDTDFHKNFCALSIDQKQVFDIVKENFLQSSRNQRIQPCKLFVTGGAGTGKSFIIRLLREYLIRLEAADRDIVLLTAPTGVAAYNIQGVTVHAAFSLPIEHGRNVSYLPLSAYKLKTLRQKLQHIKYIIIDEISMVSYRTLEFIHQRLNDIKSLSDDSQAYFGNLHIFAFGDFYQLRPVFGGYTFSGNSPVHLWKDLFTPIFLTANHRQEGDNTYASLLNRIRIGRPSDNDKLLLEQKIFTDDIDLPSRFKGALRIFPTKEKCYKYNATCLKNLLQRNGTEHIVVHAVDELIDGPPQALKTMVPAEFLPDKESDTAGLASELHLTIGSRVMLIRNIFTEHGLVNGAQGTVTGFQWPNDSPNQRTEEMPQAVLVQFDHPSVGRVLQTSCHTSITIEPITVQFHGKMNTLFKRKQFPLIPSFASTVHKVQGLSLDSAVLDIGHSIFTSGQTYVALSRIKSLEGVALMDFDAQKIMASTAVHNEMI